MTTISERGPDHAGAARISATYRAAETSGERAAVLLFAVRDGLSAHMLEALVQQHGELVEALNELRMLVPHDGSPSLTDALENATELLCRYGLIGGPDA